MIYTLIILNLIVAAIFLFLVFIDATKWSRYRGVITLFALLGALLISIIPGANILCILIILHDNGLLKDPVIYRIRRD